MVNWHNRFISTSLPNLQYHFAFNNWTSYRSFFVHTSTISFRSFAPSNCFMQSTREICPIVICSWHYLPYFCKNLRFDMPKQNLKLATQHKSRVLSDTLNLYGKLTCQIFSLLFKNRVSWPNIDFARLTKLQTCINFFFFFLSTARINGIVLYFLSIKLETSIENCKLVMTNSRCDKNSIFAFSCKSRFLYQHIKPRNFRKISQFVSWPNYHYKNQMSELRDHYVANGRNRTQNMIRVKNDQ